MAILNTGADASKGDPNNPSKAECNALRKELQGIAEAYRTSVKVLRETFYRPTVACILKRRFRLSVGIG